MKINENQKVTLTLGQLKRLVKESSNRRPMTYDEVKKLIANIHPDEPIHSFSIFGVANLWGETEGGVFRGVDPEKLTNALKNPNMRVFVHSCSDSGLYVLIGADSLIEYQRETSPNVKDQWEMSVGEQMQSEDNETVRVERLR